MGGTFGPHLRGLRQAAQLTIEELSYASGVSVRAIGDMERGVSRGPQRRTVQALAEALGLDEERRAALAEAARAGRPRATAQAPDTPRRYELPRGLADFVGRTAELELLCEQGRAASTDGPAPVVVVHGPAGLGKTACAVRAAEMLRETFPDGQLYVDLRGVDAEPMPSTEALHRLLRALGLDPRAIPDDEQERAGQLRALLADRRCLLVLDNAADEAQVRPLLPGPGAGMAIVTSRRALTGLEGVTRSALEPFSQEESAELLRAISKTPDGAPDDTMHVAQLCGHLPLALRIAGTRLASRPGWTMRHLAERLSDQDRRLANLAVGDVGVESAFALSYAALTPRAKECFRRLALVPAVDFGVPIAAVLTETDLYDAEDQLDELVELGLLQHEGVDRYRFHDLIRLYANRRLHEEDSAEARAAAEERMSDWLVGTATAAGLWFESDKDVISPGDGGRVRLSTLEEARTWLHVEKDSWLAGLRLAAAAGRDEQVAALGEAMRWFAADTQGWAGDWVEVFELTRAAAARLPDPRRELWHMNREVWATLATAQSRGGEAAQEGTQRAMEVYRLAESLGAIREQADAVCNAAEGWRQLRDIDRTLWAYSRGRELAEAAGYHQTYYWAASGEAVVLAHLGRRDEAIATYRQLLMIIDGQPRVSAAARHSRTFVITALTSALLAEERWDEAVEVAEPALAVASEQGSGFTANLHWLLGRAYVGLGANAAATEHLTRSIEKAEEEGGWGPQTFVRVRATLATVDDDHS